MKKIRLFIVTTLLVNPIIGLAEQPKQADKTSEQVTKNQDDLATGTFGTSDWRIGIDGTLYIGSGEFGTPHTGYSHWERYKNDIKNIVIEGPIMANPNSRLLFRNLEFVSEIIGLENLDTSQVTNMSSMFGDMKKLRYMNLDKFDTSQVTNMDSMFGGIENMFTLDISSFNTSNVTSMYGMFQNMYSLSSLDVSHFDTSKVTGMGLNLMFTNTKNLTSLDVTNFDTSKVTELRAMFYGMESLSSLDLSSFDISNVTVADELFENMTSLKHVKFGGGWQFPDLSYSVLPTPPTIDEAPYYYGKWQKLGGSSAYTPAELAEIYNGSTMSGDYYWAEKKKL